MPSTADFNTTIANLERTFALNSRRAKEYAETLVLKSRTVEIAASGWTEDYLKRARESLLESARWEQHRATAADGFLLVTKKDLGDPDFMHQYTDIFNEANGCGRVVWGPTAIGDNIIIDSYATSREENLAIYGFDEPKGVNGATGA